jgi:hypothetical protein
MPPTDALAAVLCTLLAHRSDAAAVLSTVAADLGLPITTAKLGLAMPSDSPHISSPPLRLPGRAALTDAFAAWSAVAAERRRLATLSASFRASSRISPPIKHSPGAGPPSPAPEVTHSVKWVERDAALRASAASLASSSSTSSLSTASPPALPFVAASELPADLASHKDRAVIVSVLSARPDRQLNRWRRRVLYTPENYVEWAEWSRPDRHHRDCIEYGKVFLDKASILTAPNLRSADVEAAADAWHSYRRHLIILFRQALTLGFSWTEILARLSATLADPVQGYPRLRNYITSALEDSALLAYPLLHADVLIYKLDASYSNGSSKYSQDSVSVEWESAVSRLEGEDPVTLAIRVTNAFVMMHDNPSFTDTSVWEKPSFVNEINNRYAKCLANDVGHPERGRASAENFMEQWHLTQARLETRSDNTTPIMLSCEHIAYRYIAPLESALNRSSAHQPDRPNEPPPSPYQLTYTNRTGAGSRARRDAARAHLQYHMEPPPNSYPADALTD